jgi:hypothetical protein
MRAKVTAPEMSLRRLLDALEEELIEATDEEILEAAGELGMNPRMKGSAAFLGLRYPYVPSAGDFYDIMNELSKNRIQLPRGLGGGTDRDPDKH